MNYNSTHFFDVDEPLPEYDPLAKERIEAEVDKRVGNHDPHKDIHRCYRTLRAFYDERLKRCLADGGDVTKMPALPQRSNFRTISDSFSRLI